jgi:hypothetical protein
MLSRPPTGFASSALPLKDMDSGHFNKLIRVIDGRPSLTTANADLLMFSKIKAKGERKALSQFRDRASQRSPPKKKRPPPMPSLTSS